MNISLSDLPNPFDLNKSRLYSDSGAACKSEETLQGGLEGFYPSNFIPQWRLCRLEERFVRRERSAAETTRAKIVTLRFLRPENPAGFSAKTANLLHNLPKA